MYLIYIREMTRPFIVSCFILFMAANVFAAPNNDAWKRVYRKTGGAPTISDSSTGIIIIGPGADSLVITRDTMISASIYIYGAGKLVVRAAKLTLYGNISATDSAQCIVSNGTLNLPQDYLYEFSVNAGGNASVLFEHSSIQIANGNAGASVVNNAKWTMHSDTFPESFFTMDMENSASVAADSCPVCGEFIFSDSSVSLFSNSGMIIAWQMITAGQVVDEQFPDTVVTQWAFPDSAKTAVGVAYRVAFAKCSNIYWTVLHGTGASLTLRNSHVRAIGLMFMGADSIAIDGIADGGTYSNMLFPDTTRVLQLVNSQVDTWNYYPFNTAKLSLTNCIFGELLASNGSSAYVTSSVCDGTGGYFSATDSAHVSAVSSTMKCPVVARNRSNVQVIYSTIETALGDDQVFAEGSGGLALLNSQCNATPRAYDTANVLVLGIFPPPRVGPGQLVALTGGAAVIPGTYSAVRFVSYTVSFGPSASGRWTWIGSPDTTQVVSGGLASWRVPQTAEGIYALHLTMQINFADSFTVSANTIVDSTLSGVSEPSALNDAVAIYPNPAQSVLNVAASNDAHIELCDLLGRVVRSADSGEGQGVTFDMAALPQGMYMLRIVSAGGVSSRMIVRE